MGFKEQITAARKELADAQRGLKGAKSAKDTKLSEIDSKIKAAEKKLNNPLYSQSGVRLYVDHVEFQGKSYRLDPSTRVEVAANGVKLEKQDNRTLYLTVHTIDGTFVARCNPDLESYVRHMGAEILNHAPNAEKNAAELQGHIQKLKVQRSDVDADFSTIDSAQANIDAKQAVIDELMANATEEERAALAKSDKTKKILKIVAIAVAALFVLGIGIGSMSGVNTGDSPTNTKQEQTASKADKKSTSTDKKSSKKNSSKSSANKLKLKGDNPLNELKIHTAKVKGASGKYAYVVASKKKTLSMSSKQFEAFSTYLKTVDYKWFTVSFGDGTGLYLPGASLNSGSCLDLNKQMSQKKGGKVYGHMKLIKKNGKNAWKYVKR